MVGCEARSERSFWSRWQPGRGKRGSCYRRLNETAMGYVKGSIDLSSMQDGLLLEQVLIRRRCCGQSAHLCLLEGRDFQYSPETPQAKQLFLHCVHVRGEHWR